jgi:DNA/RNA endonuclease G (NUC1)
MNKFFLLCLLLINTFSIYSQDTIRIKNQVFEVLYSQSLKQPIWIKYKSTNRPQIIHKFNINFYQEKNIVTSKDEDYIKNIYDRGHGAPASSFSDNIHNLKQTFSYLNCMMQHQNLNRGNWRLLEEQERIWDDYENLTILINVFFDSPIKKIRTGVAIPSFFKKHIFFEKQNKWKCFVFLNEKSKYKWNQLEIICQKSEHY